MPGAAYLSSAAALAVGCGYVILACPDEVRQAVAPQAPEIVFADCELRLEGLRKRKTATPLMASNQAADVLAIGCGLTTEPVELFKRALALNLPTVIDADGLNILSKIDVKLPEHTILTPHPKEAERLGNKEYNCVTVLKSHRSTVTAPDGRTYQNTTGNSALAKAGTGDVLTGIIAGLLAQKMETFEAACLGCYIHGLAGELASKDLTEYSVCASDVIKYIPKALSFFLK